VACGETASAAIKTDGTLWIWGGGGYGVLGNSLSANRSSPAQLGIETNWTSISLSRDFVYAIRGDNLLTWGRNTNGQLGSNSVVNRSSPVQIATNTSFVGVGQTTGYFTDTSGRLWAAGQNSYGQIGGGNILSASSPVQTILTDTNWFRVCGNIQSSYALRYIPGPTPTSTSITLTPSPSPTPTPTPTQPSKVLYNTGLNNLGKLGINSINLVPEYNPTKMTIDEVPWFYAIDSDRASMGIKTDGTLWVCGDNAYSTLGDNTSINRSRFVQTAAGGNTWSKIAMSPYGYAFYAIKLDGTLWVWGYNGSGELGSGVPGQTIASPKQTSQLGTNWLVISAGLNVASAVKTDGTLWAMGSNVYFGCGLPLDDSYLNPTRVGTATDWAYVNQGVYTSFAIKKNGTLWAVGSNAYGILGTNNTIHRSVYTQVGTSNNWKMIAHTNSYPDFLSSKVAYALKTDNTLWGWGLLREVDYSTKIYSSPVQISPKTDWASIRITHQMWSDYPRWEEAGVYLTDTANNLYFIAPYSNSRSPVQYLSGTWQQFGNTTNYQSPNSNGFKGIKLT
jgi:alpha-tubulin suppressor-like RCC1 family protein